MNTKMSNISRKCFILKSFKNQILRHYNKKSKNPLINLPIRINIILSCVCFHSFFVLRHYNKKRYEVFRFAFFRRLLESLFIFEKKNAVLSQKENMWRHFGRNDQIETPKQLSLKTIKCIFCLNKKY